MPAWMTGAKTVSFSLESANISGIWSSKLRETHEQRRYTFCTFVMNFKEHVSHTSSLSPNTEGWNCTLAWLGTETFDLVGTFPGSHFSLSRYFFYSLHFWSLRLYILK